jgi:hypothetical protein
VAAAAAMLLAVGLHNIGPNQPVVEPANPPQDATRIVAGSNLDPNLGPDDANPISSDPIDPLPDPGNLDPEQYTGTIGVTADDQDDPVGDLTTQPQENPGLVPSINTEPIIGEADDDFVPFAVALDLPQPAYQLLPPTDGVFTLAVLAIYEDCDAILPSINEAGAVEFYTKYKNKNHKWAQALVAGENPEHQEEVKALPTVTEIMGIVEESAAAGFSRVSAASPDGLYSAVNQGGEQPGIWRHKIIALMEESAEQAEQEPGLQIAATGGGKVLCWSPDSNKLIYTDSTGKLFVYYLFEKKTQPLFSGAVSCASWAKDSKTVVFSGKIDKKANSAIYTIIVP